MIQVQKYDFIYYTHAKITLFNNIDNSGSLYFSYLNI